MNERMDSPKWVDSFARIGYLAKGVIYLTIAGLAVNQAMGSGGDSPDAKSALAAFAGHPLGWVVLILLMVGLVCYVVWRVVSTFAPMGGDKSGLEKLAERAGRAASGFVYAGLAVAAGKHLMGMSTGGQEGTAAMSETAMDQPLGEWAVIGAGLVMIGVAIRFAYQAWTASYRKKFTVTDGNGEMRRGLDHIARAGIAARSVVFFLMGGFLVLAGWRSDADEAEGMGGALRSLETQPYGAWLLGIVAAGLAAYGVYCFVRARYGHIK